MKINCGPTEAERTEAEKQWHRWFAWKPVRLRSHDCRWLETVERRRRVYDMLTLMDGSIHNYHSPYFWEYRAVSA